MWKRLYDYLRDQILYKYTLIIICLVWVVVFLWLEYLLIKLNFNNMIFVRLALLLSFIGLILIFQGYAYTINTKDYYAELLLYYLEQHFSILGKAEKLTMQQYPANALEAYHDLKKKHYYQLKQN